LFACKEVVNAASVGAKNGKGPVPCGVVARSARVSAFPRTHLTEAILLLNLLNIIICVKWFRTSLVVTRESLNCNKCNHDKCFKNFKYFPEVLILAERLNDRKILRIYI
jgi:hypothetical protein